MIVLLQTPKNTADLILWAEWARHKKQCIRPWVTSRLTWALVRCWPAYFECFYQLKDNLTDWKINQPNISYSANNHFHKKKKRKDIKPQQHYSTQRCVQMHAYIMRTTRQKCIPLELLELYAIAVSGFHIWFMLCSTQAGSCKWTWSSLVLNITA